MRDSSQAQKLCSLLAGGSEPAPLLGSSSILLYSCAPAALAVDGGRETSRSCSAGRDGSIRLPTSLLPSALVRPWLLEAFPSSCPVSWPHRALLVHSKGTNHLIYRSPHVLQTGSNNVTLLWVPVRTPQSHKPDTSHTLPGIHFHTRGWLFLSSTAPAEGLSQLQRWGLSVLSTGGTLPLGLCGHCGPLTHHRQEMALWLSPI